MAIIPFRSAILASGALAAASTAASAGVEFSADTLVTFDNVTGEENLAFSLINGAAAGEASSLVHGEPDDTEPSGEGNRLEATGLSFDTPIDEEFLLADLTYFNRITVANTNATGVDIVVDLVFTNPGDVNGETFTFVFGGSFILTPNDTGDPVLDADFFNIDGPKDLDAKFISGGVQYRLEIAGFREEPGGPLVDSFVLPEDSKATAGLFAKIVVVPAPGATAVLGLAGVTIVRRRRQR